MMESTTTNRTFSSPPRNPAAYGLVIALAWALIGGATQATADTVSPEKPTLEALLRLSEDPEVPKATPAGSLPPESAEVEPAAQPVVAPGGYARARSVSIPGLTRWIGLEVGIGERAPESVPSATWDLHCRRGVALPKVACP